MKSVDDKKEPDQKFELLCITWKSTVIQSSLCHGNPIKAQTKDEADESWTHKLGHWVGHGHRYGVVD